MHTFKQGDRVVLARDVDRFPDFLATQGMTGTVDTVEIDGSIAVKMDSPLEGCEEWDNCVCWYDDEQRAAIDDDIVPLPAWWATLAPTVE